MGQRITVDEPVVLDDVAILATDRSLTGMEGCAFTSREDAERSSGFPARLAARLLAADPALRRVYVTMNTVVLRRDGGWDADRLAAATQVVADLFRFYPG